MINGENIASNIRAERVRSGLSVEDVCNGIGITRQTYAKYEKDANIIPVKTLVILSVMFNCNVENFFVQRQSTKCQ